MVLQNILPLHTAYGQELLRRGNFCCINGTVCRCRVICRRAYTCIASTETVLFWF